MKLISERQESRSELFRARMNCDALTIDAGLFELPNHDLHEVKEHTRWNGASMSKELWVWLHTIAHITRIVDSK